MTDAVEDVWALIPSANCKGLCAESCGPIGAGLAERERIWERHGVALPDPFDGGPLALRCPLLTVDDRCSTYADRPTICRLYGVVEDLPCPHGCRPTMGYLPAEHGRALLRRSIDAT